MNRDHTQDDAEAVEGSGLPGYSANNTIPGGFVLPLPGVGGGAVNAAPTDADLDDGDGAAADPWSSSWDDDSWQTDAASTGYLPPVTYEPEAGAETSWVAGTETDWSQWEVGDDADTATTDSSDDTGSYAAYAPDTTATDLNGSGWVPAGYDAARETTAPSSSTASSFPTGSYTTVGHEDSVRAYAQAPEVDPDVAAAAAERGTAPAAYSSSARPSADELIAVRSKGERERNKASSGIRKAFGLGPGIKEMLERDRIDRIARPLNGRKTIMVINTKGGGGKTLVTLMLASYLGRYRSGSVLAWDNNETEGTLGMRAPSSPHHRTVVDLLGALPQIASDPNAGTSDLEHWVREQRGLSFDVLASADDDEAMRIVGEQEFDDLHTQLSRFYRMIVVDTGNNRLSPNWLAAAARADMLVFATSLKDDTSVVAAKNLDALVAMGRADLVRNAVCVISHTSNKGNDVGAGVHTREHFEQWVRAVVDIPYDRALAPGLQLDPMKISRKAHDACMEMAATVVDGL